VGIDGLDVEWPDAEAVRCGPDADVTIRDRPRWTPALPVDLFRAAGEMPHSTSLNRVERGDSEYAQVTGSVPTTLSKAVGLGTEYDRAAVTMDCVDGRPVMVMTPTDTPAEKCRNSVAVNLAAPETVNGSSTPARSPGYSASNSNSARRAAPDSGGSNRTTRYVRSLRPTEARHDYVRA